jgi:hypothetical protein
LLAWVRGSGSDQSLADRLASIAPEGPVPGPHASLVKAARSSWVHRLEAGPDIYYFKTYAYAMPRTLLSSRARAVREYEACVWLRRNGFEAPRPVAAGERRAMLLIRRCALITAAWSGDSLALLLPTLAQSERDHLAKSLIDLVRAWHRLGYRDRNLDLRNLLARRRGPDWHVAKLDSPRWCLVPFGTVNDRLATADWLRLLPQLHEAGVSSSLLVPPT